MCMCNYWTVVVPGRPKRHFRQEAAARDYAKDIAGAKVEEPRKKKAGPTARGAARR